jgi:hypothetical protein
MTAGDPHGREGRYRIWICESGCSSTDSSRASFIGDIVLHNEPVQWPELKAPHDTSLFAYYVTESRRKGSLNACWDFTTFRERTLVNRRGLTAWLLHDTGEFSMLLYQSPDTFYELRIVVRSDSLRGTGVLSGFVGSAFVAPSDQVFGRRIGTADRSICVAVGQRLREEVYRPPMPAATR